MVEGNRVALIVACDRYADPELKQLQAPSQDAETLARILEDPKIGRFKVTALINQPHWTVTEKINEFLHSCNRGDTVLLYFSCHGIKDKDGQLYFATITTNRTLLYATGIGSDFVNKVLDHCRALQKVVLLDCCYSGAFEKGRIVRAHSQVNATEFFGRGNVIITASDSMQYAIEDDKIENLGKGGSYFTNALIKGLESGEADVNNDGKITYSELYNYVHEYVRKITPDQTPTLNARGVEGDFVIFKNANYDIGSNEDGGSDEKDSIFRLLRRAREFLEEEQYDNAIKLFDSVLLLNVEHIEALNGKGVALYKQEKYREALGCFNEVLKIKPKHPEASMYAEMSTNRIGKERKRKVKPSGKIIEHDLAQEKRVENRVKKAIDESTQIPEELIRKGDEFYANKLYEKAILCYDQALKIEPRSELAWNNKGNALDAKGDYEEALSSFNEALKINPSSQMYRDRMRIELKKLGLTDDEAEAWYGKGEALYGLQKYEEAIDCYDKAIVLNPKYTEAWYGKGVSLFNLGRHKEAVVSYNEAIENNPRYTEAWYGKGVSLFNLSKYKEAIDCYDKAILLNPKYATAWYNKANALFNLGRHKEAVVSYNEAIENNPRYTEAWYGKGNALYGLQKYEEAIGQYNKALELDPNYLKAWYNKGLALNSLGNYEEAIKQFDKALEIDPKFDQVLNGKGNALYGLQKYEEAIDCYERALKINPHNQNSRRDMKQAMKKLFHQRGL